MSTYQIFTDSSSDLTTEMREKWNIDYFRMVISKDGKEYPADLDYKLYSKEQLYDWIKDPKVDIKTSLIGMNEFLTRLTPYLEKGIDILYIACTSVLSGSLNFFRLAAEELHAKFPERKLIAVDSCRAGMTLGLMVMDACKVRDEGKSAEEVAEWVEENKQFYNMNGTVPTLSFLKQAGRVSGAAAFFANTLNIKPIIIADTLGHNYTIKKVRGFKTALDLLFHMVQEQVEGIEKPVIYVGQGAAQETSDYFKKRFTEELNAEVVEYWVGPIIGISCGPGVIHLICRGKEVTVTAPSK